ncbi:hypothetical protein [Hubei virga-like virus 21]|uniref:hypothetical protein n=1 Tax=Hubei virga-like virus 21 TaxID=1923336 RepID=UPI00090A8ED3|nr:hypothetical protein [Hubei virga-like virus 21]APG77652.1 hypothetical protein [Hubei virga-like virus 21]
MVNGAFRRSRARATVARRSFLDSLLVVLLRVVAHPVSLVLAVFLVLFVAAEVLETTGPLESLDKLIKQELGSKDINSLEKFLLKGFDKCIVFVILYKTKVVATLAYSIFVALNPTKLRWSVFGAAVLIVVAIPSLPVFYHIITAVALVFYLALQRIEHKALTVFIYVAGMVLYTSAVVVSVATAGAGKRNSTGAP